MLDNLIICQIGTRLHGTSRDPAFPLHEGSEYRLKRLIIPDNSSGLVDITRDGHKPLRRAGQIHLQAMLAVVDVVDGLVISELRRQAEKATQS